MTAVEEIRKAAALMREIAETATPGPWEITDNSDGQSFVHDGAGLLDVEVCSTDDYCTVHFVRQTADAHHIASWHPQVALAVADLLDAEAAHTELIGEGWFPNRTALAVARAYLGGES